MDVDVVVLSAERWTGLFRAAKVFAFSERSQSRGSVTA